MYLTIREAVGMLVRLGGVAVVTRLLGPAHYGAYFGAASFVSVVATATQMGAELWLIRQHDDPTQEQMEEVFTALFVVAMVVTAVVLLASIPASLVVASSRLMPFRLLVLSVPINVLWAPAQARIERNFEYRKMAWLELGGDLVLYAVAVPLALAGLGVYSLVCGYLAWQSFLLVGSFAMARFRPRLRWSRPLTSELIRHGLGYSSNDWCQRLAGLSATVVVGIVDGATGVGLLGLALRLVDTVSFALRATWRLGMATLSRLADDLPRLRQALEEGMLAQAVVLGAPMLAFALASHWLVPLLFGKVWLPSATLFSILCVGKLISSPAQLQTTLLYMQGRISDVTRASAVVAVLVWAAAVPLTIAYGTRGYCLAVTVSSVGYVLVDRATTRVTAFRRREVALCLLAFVPGLLIPTLTSPFRWLLLAPLGLLVTDGALRRLLGGFFLTLLNELRSRYGAPGPGDAAGQAAGSIETSRTAEEDWVVFDKARTRGRLGFAWRRGWVVVVCLVGCTGGAYAYRHASPATYVARASLVVDAGARSTGPGDATDAVSLASTYASVVPDDVAVLRAVATAVGRSVGVARSSIAVTAEYETAVLDVSYRSTDPGLAVRGANALADSLSRSSGNGLVAGGRLRIVGRAQHATASSGIHRDVLPLGILGGLLLGLAGAVGWERLDPRIDNDGDLSDLLGLPVVDRQDLTRSQGPVYAERWLRSRRGGRPVTIVPGTRELVDVARGIAEDLATFGADGEFVATASPHVPGWPSGDAGLVVLVVRTGAHARQILHLAGRLALDEQPLGWAVLV